MMNISLNNINNQLIPKWLFAFVIHCCIFTATTHTYSQNNFYQYYNINKIRSNEVIKSISKDNSGFIWLATDQGVLRYDGSETYMFYKELPSPYAKKFLKRKNGDFLVVTDFGLRQIIWTDDTTYFKPISIGGKEFHHRLNYPKSIYEDIEGNLWAGEVNAVTKISDKGYKEYILGDDYQSINYHRSFSFTEDAFGNLWAAPYKGRLLSYNKEQDTFDDVDIHYPLTEVSCIAVLKGDNLIIGGREGILRIKIDSDKNILESEFIKGLGNISTALIIENELYLGTWNEGLYYANLRKAPIDFQKVPEIPFSDILDFYLDESEQEVWLAGSENIGLLKPSIIKSIKEAGSSRIESLSCDNSGNIYFSSGQQLYKLGSDNQRSLIHLTSSTSTYLNRVLWDGDKLWLGGAFKGISFFNLENHQYHNLWDSTGNAIQYILKDYQENKWFTGHPDALMRIDKSNKITAFKNVKKSAVIKESLDRKIYCGAHGIDSLLYIYIPEEDNFQLLNLEYDFSPSINIQVEDIAFDSLGFPWLATSEGLLQIRPGNGKYLASRMQLKGIHADEPIKAIAIINNNIWLSYSFGLAVLHKGEVMIYTRENGLPSRVLKERGLLYHNDRLYVATAKGLAEININKAEFTVTAPPRFKNLNINGNRYSFASTSNLTLPFGARAQMDYVSLSYPGNNILYQTRLAGLEEAWSEPTPNNSISVLGFSEGNYTLEVRAREDGKLWSEPIYFQFSVAPPWYKSWWAMILMVMAAVSLVYGSSKAYHYHLVRQRTKLKQIIEERTAEINLQKNQIIEQKNKIIQQKEELIEKNNAVFHSQKALSEADLNYMHLKEKQLQDQISYRNKQITTHTLNIIQKNEMLRELKDQLEAIIKKQPSGSSAELKKMLKTIDESFRHDKDWDEFKIYFEQIYAGFYSKLKVNYPELTNQELRHCALIRLNLRNAECASILGISPNSIKVSRNRLKKKLNLEINDSLTDFLISL